MFYFMTSIDLSPFQKEAFTKSFGKTKPSRTLRCIQVRIFLKTKYFLSMSCFNMGMFDRVSADVLETKSG